MIYGITLHIRFEENLKAAVIIHSWRNHFFWAIPQNTLAFKLACKVSEIAMKHLCDIISA